LDRTELTKADENIRYMEWFLDEVKEAESKEDSTEERAKVAEVLQWHLKIAKVHYRNLLHCFKIAENTSKD